MQHVHMSTIHRTDHLTVVAAAASHWGGGALRHVEELPQHTQTVPATTSKDIKIDNTAEGYDRGIAVPFGRNGFLYLYGSCELRGYREETQYIKREKGGELQAMTNIEHTGTPEA